MGILAVRQFPALRKDDPPVACAPVLSHFDYAILGFYFAYLLAVGWVFRRFVHTVSDFFRSGGQAMWWMVGGSAFMMSFSAWTFTGAASRAYGDGWPIGVIYAGNAFGFALNAVYFAPRFRQLRVITSMEAVRARFGPANEQVFTWLTVPLRTMYAGIWLYGLGVFCSAAFQIDVRVTILLAGGTVVAISLLGGSWAVVASDFIQTLILMPVTLVASVLAVAKLGGPAGFVHRLSATHLDPHKLVSERFLGLWCVAIFLKQFVATNNLAEAYRYLSVKDSRQARRAAWLASALMILGVLIWFVPPMAASVEFPDLARIYPHLPHPGEGAYFAIATSTLPIGMLGLLVSGIFATTMSAMDGGLNSNAGIFVKNFYQPFLRRDAGERELLLAGKSATAALGLAIVSLALVYSHFEEMTLFELMLDFAILVALPLTIPLLLGIVIRRTPAWSGWSTVIVGFATSLATGKLLTVGWASGVFGLSESALSTWEVQNWKQAVAVFTVAGTCTSWFWFTSLFFRRTSAGYQADIERFSQGIDTPVDYDREETAPPSDARQYRLIGWLAIPYGVVIALLALIPNPPEGRAAFVFCGGVLVAVGAVLARRGRASDPNAVSRAAPVSSGQRRR